MITDKELKSCDTVCAIDIHYAMQKGTVYDGAKIVSRIRQESADQARKESAEWAVEYIASAFSDYDGSSYSALELQSAILDNTVKEGKTDSEKLAIAVKALEDIREMRWGDSWKVARDALKGIHG